MLICAAGRLDGQVKQFVHKGLHYFVYYGEYEDTIYGAFDQCQAIGGKIADVPDYSIFEMLNHTLPRVLGGAAAADRPFFIDSWQNDDYYPYCLAFYVGTMVNQPENGCEGPLPYICELPVSRQSSPQANKPAP